MVLGGRGTFHSSWAREVLATEPGDHVNLGSLFLATPRGTKVRGGDNAFRSEDVKNTFLPLRANQI